MVRNDRNDLPQIFFSVRPSVVHQASIRPSVCPSVVEKMFTEILRNIYGNCFNFKTPPWGTESCLTFAFDSRFDKGTPAWGAHACRDTTLSSDLDDFWSEMIVTTFPRFFFLSVRPSSIKRRSVRPSVHPSSKRCLRKFYGTFMEIVLTLKRHLGERKVA